MQNPTEPDDMSRPSGKNKGGRPRGPEKRDITLSLTVPVMDWLDAKLAANEFSSKSWFVDKVLTEEMEREKAGKKA